MPDTVEIAVRLRCFLRREGTYWVSGCPSLDVYSQAETAEGAREALREAVELWVESCLERGTLEQALREVGWRFMPSGSPVPPEGEYVGSHQLEPADEVLGEPFPLEVSIPAFQAAPLPGPGHRAAG